MRNVMLPEWLTAFRRRQVAVPLLLALGLANVWGCGRGPQPATPAPAAPPATAERRTLAEIWDDPQSSDVPQLTQLLQSESEEQQHRAIVVLGAMGEDALEATPALAAAARAEWAARPEGPRVRELLQAIERIDPAIQEAATQELVLAMLSQSQAETRDLTWRWLQGIGEPAVRFLLGDRLGTVAAAIQEFEANPDALPPDVVRKIAEIDGRMAQLGESQRQSEQQRERAKSAAERQYKEAFTKQRAAEERSGGASGAKARAEAKLEELRQQLDIDLRKAEEEIDKRQNRLRADAERLAIEKETLKGLAVEPGYVRGKVLVLAQDRKSIAAETMRLLPVDLLPTKPGQIGTVAVLRRTSTGQGATYGTFPNLVAIPTLIQPIVFVDLQPGSRPWQRQFQERNMPDEITVFGRSGVPSQFVPDDDIREYMSRIERRD